MGSGDRRNQIVPAAIVVLLLNIMAMFSELCTRTLVSSSTPSPSSKSLAILELLLPSQVANEKDQSLSSLCTQNPYISALGSSLEDISSRMDEWFSDVDRHRIRAAGMEMSRHDHARFFPFQVLEPCQQKTCVGGKCHQDTSKIVCGLEQLQNLSTTTESDNDNSNNNSCVIYSIGGNNLWQFENDLLQKTPCEIHTFDCTGRLSRFQKPDHKRLHFHHICLGTQHEKGKTEQECELAGGGKCGETWSLAEIQNKLQHKRIDLLKMDIEGFEWPLLESWPEVDINNNNNVQGKSSNESIVLPMQILVEIHYQTQFEELRPSTVGVYEDFKTSLDMVELQAHLLRMGYIVVEREDNKFCRHCTELTLIRSRCPGKV